MRPGDLIGVGGAVCVVPERCSTCGGPAEHFEPRPAADPSRNHILGLCTACRDHRDAVAAWQASLDPETARRVEHLEYEVEYLEMGAADYRLTDSTRREARRDADRKAALLRDLYRSTGRPERS